MSFTIKAALIQLLSLSLNRPIEAPPCFNFMIIYEQESKVYYTTFSFR